MRSIVIITLFGFCNSQWHHDWDTVQSMWWGDFGYSLLSDTQAKFIAYHYKIVSLEKCTGHASHMDTEAAIYQTAAQLKKFNPMLKVLFYWSVSQAGIQCYAANQMFTAHPEWHLKDDYGNIYQPPRIDVTIQAAQDWWLSIPLGGNNSSNLIDGILADDAGYNSYPNMTKDRMHSLYEAKLALLARMQTIFTQKTKDGIVLGNGFSEYDQSPRDPHNRKILQYVNAVQSEHYAVFEQVDPKTGELKLDKVADVLNNIEWASQNKNKTVFASFWPGRIVGFNNGWPKYVNNSQPIGMDAWRKVLKEQLLFQLASFLIVADTNVYMTYAVWYELHQGFVTCPENPESCCTPPDFYPELRKALGSPIGPRIQRNTYQWQREFQHATVLLDLTDVTATNISWL